jgi:hypothetical protein
LISYLKVILLIGTAGFELATPCTPCKSVPRKDAPSERPLSMQSMH